VKRVWGVIFFLTLAIFLHSPQTLYINEGNIFDEQFTAPVETLYLICFDGYAYGLSTHDSHTVDVSAYYVKTFLEERGRTLKDVAIIMHNHFAMPMLSGSDRIFLLRARNHGFRGSFGVYITATQKVIYEKPWLRGIR